MGEYLSEINADCLWDFIAPEDAERRLEREREKSVAVTASCEMQKMRRIASEFALEKELPWHFEKGTTYHCISYGDVDSMTYLRVVLKQQPLEYLMLATWCIALADAQELKRFLDKGYIKRIDFYVGDLFRTRYEPVFDYISENCLVNGGMITCLKSHCKTMACFGEKFDRAIESSANMNENPRIENTAITVNTEVALFYKDFFDSLGTQDQKNGWQPYILDR